MKNPLKNKLKAMSRANEALYLDKACPVCGARLAVCRKPQGAGDFPVLNLEAQPEESVYYCPICRKYLDIGGEYAPYAPWRHPPFAGDERRYYFTKAFVNGRILRTLFIQAFAALFILFPFLYMVQALLRNFTLLNWAGAAFCGVLLFVSAYFMSYYYRMWRVGRRSYFELGEKDQPDIYTFDTANRSVVFNSNLEHYQDIALRTARRLRDGDVPINPRLLYQLYP